ncbi:hypothetical protein EDD18DRAFT_1201833 [Armillaria luteobubalina]|uniref:BTB domain-containing protein n=1 Tax=Armillaria luteobubalina TaxID=153913 RepID=A0AA39PD86_9AGAR|nr:hypothetical protein EDD18DRAFT_1201833 [Armillaria luteobubalina]
MATTQTSDRFNASDSDITLKSCDDVLFRVHRVNLEMHSQVFADAGGSTIPKQQEVVPLTERAEVLELMLQYMYLQHQPDLRNVKFEVLKDLAEAVEKYEIYSAMGVCAQKMKESIAEHPLDVLLYSVRHKHEDVINECAEASINMSTTDMLRSLPSDIFAAWIRYHQDWTDLMNREYTRFGPTRHHKNVTVHHCEIWAENYACIAHEIAGRPQNLLKLRSLLQRRQQTLGNRCEDCKRELGYWYHQADRDRSGLPQFSEYL